MNSFEHGRGSAVRVDRAVDPGVSVIARDHPIFTAIRPWDLSYNVPDGLFGVVLLDYHFDRDFTLAPDVIVEGEGSLKSPGSFRPSDLLEDR